MKDYQTNTVSGAEAFERGRSEDIEPEYTKWDAEADEREEIEEEDDEDYCNCSDPGCHCGGIKKGSL